MAHSTADEEIRGLASLYAVGALPPNAEVSWLLAASQQNQILPWTR